MQLQASCNSIKKKVLSLVFVGNVNMQTNKKMTHEFDF